MYTDRFVRRWLPVLTVVVLAGWTGLSLAQEKKIMPPKAKDLLGVAQDIEGLKTFCKLVESAELAETLKGKGPFTIFAPTDDAFLKLGEELDALQKPENKAKLQHLLKNHVVDGRKLSAEFSSMKSAKTLAEETINITVADDEITVGGAKVIKADVLASNGMAHVVDAVIKAAPPQPKP